ncbi:MAG: hypothetical protein ACRCZB_05455 [Bacteroidales bacterium]
MRTAIRKLSEAQLQDMKEKAKTEREQVGKNLVEALIRRPNFGAGLEEASARDPRRVTNLAFAIQHTEEHLSELSEAQISATLGTAPENVLRVLRLGYLNTCRQDAFWEMGLSSAHDMFFYLEPKYKKTLRGATAGEVMYESSSYRSASDIGIWESEASADGVKKIFDFQPDSTEVPISPYTVKIIVNNGIVANDDGRGKITGVDSDGTPVSGSVNYTTGAIMVQLDTAPVAGSDVSAEAGIAIESDDSLAVTQEVELTLKAKPFTLREYPITASFSKKLELTLGTSFKVDAEEAYLRAMSDELRKTLDFQAFSMGYKQANTNSKANQVTFNMQGAVGESEDARIQVISRKIDAVGTQIYEALQRGGVTKIFGGAGATGVLTGHRRWTDEGAQNANGIYKLGKLGDIDVFRTPSSICPNDELTCIYKNQELPEDVFMMIGTLVPLYVTDKLTMANRQTQMGVASYGDIQINQKAYARTMKILNL